MEELNKISKEEIDKIDNTLPDYKNDDGSKLYEKDRLGVWTEKEIADNPIAYIEHLREKLQNNIYRQDLVSKISQEIKRVEKEYLSSDYAIGKKR